ncbi:TonB box-containing protein [Flammula alnicola]|nr:TonB box-containing protein [Flammula alnicola]
MDLYLISTNPENTMLVSANGVTHYQIVTARSTQGPRVTSILRLAGSLEDSIVAEIEWKNRGTPTIIRSPLLSGVGQCVGTRGVGIRALRYLYKRHKFSPSRYFIGDDAFEYRWKMVKGSGCILMRPDTNTEIASSICVLVSEGVFAGEKKQVLRIQPCSVDIDLVVLTFIIMEKKRRERDGYADAYSVAHDEEPQGDGGGSGDGDAGAGVIGEL